MFTVTRQSALVLANEPWRSCRLLMTTSPGAQIIGTAPGSHNSLDVTGTLTFEGASELTITSSGGASTGTYTLVTTSAPPAGRA